MKELSIEEKARRYDEAKYIMKEYLESGIAGVIAENTIKKAFPELAESENERIRKALITFFNRFPYDSIEAAGTNAKEAIAWLEKQDKKPTEIRETKPKDISEFLNRLNTVEQEFLLEHIAKIRELDKEEQNPADWSKEDDYNLQCCVAKVQYDIDNGRIGRNRELLTWLKSLKHRSQWRPSEEQMDNK